MDIVRSLVSVDGFKVEHVPNHLIFAGNSVSAVHIPRGARDILRSFSDLQGVLRGADFSQFRPSVIVVEGQAAVPKWEKLLTDQCYRYVVHDGVNRWYCCESRNDYAELLRPPVSAVDNFRRYDQIGSPLSNSVHPEHRWAVGLSHKLICALKAVSNDVIVAAYTDKIADHLLDKPCDASIYRGATRAVLGRQPNDTDWALFEEQDNTTTIREIYERLVNSEEFLMKRGRAIASM